MTRAQPADMLTPLPDDARRNILQRLPATSLFACEAVSKHMRAAVVEDEIWQPICGAYWPRCNLGRTTASCRDCFTSANGWRNLATLPRALLDTSAPTTRRSTPISELRAFDADDEAIVYGTADGKVRLSAHDELDLGWNCKAAQRLQDVKLLSGEGGAIALLFGGQGLIPQCMVVHLKMHSAGYAAADAALPDPIWSNAESGAAMGLHRYDKLLLCSPSHAYLLNTFEMAYPLHRLDLGTGALTLHGNVHHKWPEPLEFRSACNDGEYAPHELTVASCSGGQSFIAHYDVRMDMRDCVLGTTGHANVRRVCQGNRGTPFVLTSHSRSKSIEVWDLRRFGALATAASQTLHPKPVDAFRCAGNAPDMYCAHGVIAAISGGPPGSTYGAKLHIFSSSPRRLSVDCTLPEIVIDDGHRLSCPLGITIGVRTLTLMADRQRLLRVSVP